VHDVANTPPNSNINNDETNSEVSYSYFASLKNNTHKKISEKASYKKLSPSSTSKLVNNEYQKEKNLKKK
jgi:hypothetical protein